MKLFITADTVGGPTGGGIVTQMESKALADMDQSVGVAILSRTSDYFPHDPFEQDRMFLGWVRDNEKMIAECGGVTHAHCYAGCLTETVQYLKATGAKVSYTAAAHSIEASRQAHADLGLPFNYPHLTDPETWKRYVGGYLAADLVICPSTHSKECMQEYGCKNVVVVPHGCELPTEVKPPPSRFTVGYLGAYGPDKGVRWLLEAWKILNIPVEDAQLVLAGRDSVSPFVDDMVRRFYGGSPHSVQQVGWVKNVTDFYNSISLYVQPSTTEGFGIEVLEALAHGRPVLCSTGAGACDLVSRAMRFPPRDPGKLAECISFAQCGWAPEPEQCRRVAAQHTWEKIRLKYQEAWRAM